MVPFYPEVVAFTKESDNLYVMDTNSELCTNLKTLEISSSSNLSICLH